MYHLKYNISIRNNRNEKGKNIVIGLKIRYRFFSFFEYLTPKESEEPKNVGSCVCVYVCSSVSILLFCFTF